MDERRALRELRTAAVEDAERHKKQYEKARAWVEAIDARLSDLDPDGRAQLPLPAVAAPGAMPRYVRPQRPTLRSATEAIVMNAAPNPITINEIVEKLAGTGIPLSKRAGDSVDSTLINIRRDGGLVERVSPRVWRWTGFDSGLPTDGVDASSAGQMPGQSS
jgi:hypothetical protein